MPDERKYSDITLREWFASQALSALITSVSIHHIGGFEMDKQCAAAYAYADTMIKAGEDNV